MERMRSLPIEQDQPDVREIRSIIEGVSGVRIAHTERPIPDWKYMVERLWRAPITILSIKNIER